MLRRHRKDPFTKGNPNNESNDDWLTRGLGALLLTCFASVTLQAEAQCVENHSGYSAKVRWYKNADWEYRTQLVNAVIANPTYCTVQAAGGPLHEENVNNNVGAENSRVCYGAGNVVVVTVRGGIYSKVAIWAVIAVAIRATCVAADSACELAWELGSAGGSAATSNIPNAKEAIWASQVVPGKAVILWPHDYPPHHSGSPRRLQPQVQRRHGRNGLLQGQRRSRHLHAGPLQPQLGRLTNR